jgi:serine protease inhibitor
MNPVKDLQATGATLRTLLTLLALAALAGAGCESVSGPRPGAQGPLEALPRALTSAEREVIAGSNRFAFELLRQTVAHEAADNVLLSPLSASMALGLTLNGAREETFAEMRRTLGFEGLDQAAINASYRSLIDLLRTVDPGVDMRVANSIWSRSGYPFHASFFEAPKAYFDAEVATLDFDDAAVRRINAWVDGATRGRITEIIEYIPGNVVMYLINAIYFKGTWVYRFDPARTRDAPFHMADGSSRTVRMMSRTGPAALHTAADGTTVLEQTYGRGAFAMTIVLPPPGTGVDELIGRLSPELWQEWLAGLTPGEQLRVELPRFRLELDYTLNDPLSAAGMPDAFDPARADFSGMSPHRLYISEVRQKTFVEVNEEGTEAAAVTSVAMAESLGPGLTADRPFLLAIRERFSGALLFLGKVGAP